MKTFSVKAIVCLAKSNQTFAKIHSFILPYFFPLETPFSKSIYKVSGKKDAEAYSELSQTSKMDFFP